MTKITHQFQNAPRHHVGKVIVPPVCSSRNVMIEAIPDQSFEETYGFLEVTPRRIPMNKHLVGAVTALTDRLLTKLAQEDGLWEDLRALAGAFLVATERPALPQPELGRQVTGRSGPAQPEPELPLPLYAGESAATPDPVPSPPLPELTLGRYHLSDPCSIPEYTPAFPQGATTNDDLPAIEARCRLKAEGVRWAATRRRLKNEGTTFHLNIAPRDREFHHRAKKLGCYLWMNRPDFTVPIDLSSLEDVAGCFDAVADAVALVRGMLPDLEDNRECLEPAIDLLAEAQSALRVAIDRIDAPNDQDQFRVYDWLRGIAAREQIFIRRFMRLDDPADPAHLPEIEALIETLDTRLQEVRRRAKKKKSPLNRLRYHAKLIAEGRGCEHDWRKVAGAIGEMVGEGVLVSSVQIREVLIPILDALPDLEGLPPEFGLVMREIDRYLAGRMPVPDETTPAVPTADVAKAAQLLSGKVVVLIGGDRRPEACEALKAALGLKELVWIETKEHESINRFEPYVARTEVSLVLLAIRWSSHSFGEVKGFCDRYGKALVRLPGGYNPNQVAAQIIAQCSGQLARAG